MDAESINALRFRKRAEEMLSGDAGKSSAEVFLMIKYSAQHLATKSGEPVDEVRDLHRRAQQKMEYAGRSSRASTTTAEGEETRARAKESVESVDLKEDKPASRDSGKKRLERKVDRHYDNKEVGGDEESKTTAAGITSLLQQSADISAQEVEQERQKHTEMLLHISDLVGNLKDSTMLMNKLVVEQNVHLEQIQQAAGENVEELEQQKKSMEKETKKMTMSFWTTIYTALWLISMFVATYVVIKIFPKPVSVQALPRPFMPRVRSRAISLRMAGSAPSQPAIEAFEREWEKASVETLPNIRHAFFPDLLGGTVRGLGCTSADDLQSGSELVSLPLKQCLYTQGKGGQSTEEIPMGRLRECVEKELWQRIKGTTRLSLMLLDSYIDSSSGGGSGSGGGEGTKALLQRYIDILPGEGELETPIHWLETSTSAFTSLDRAYPPLASRVRAQQKSYRTLYNLLLTPSVSSGKALIPDEQQVTYSRFVWAMESVTSRAFQGVGGLGSTASKFQLGAVVSAACVSLAFFLAFQPIVTVPGGFLDRESLITGLGTIGALTLLPSVFDSAGAGSEGTSVVLPVIDSCNHRNRDSANCEMAFEVSREAFVLRSRVPRGGITASASAGGDDDESKGGGAGELTISYGDRDNDDFLQFFGFVERDNPYDCYRFCSSPEQDADVDVDVVVTRGPREEWTLPSSLESNDSTLRSVLREQLDRVLEARNAIEVAGSDDSYSSSKQERLLVAFLTEKTKVLEAAIIRV